MPAGLTPQDALTGNANMSTSVNQIVAALNGRGIEPLKDCMEWKVVSRWKTEIDQVVMEASYSGKLWSTLAGGDNMALSPAEKHALNVLKVLVAVRRTEGIVHNSATKIYKSLREESQDEQIMTDCWEQFLDRLLKELGPADAFAHTLTSPSSRVTLNLELCCESPEKGVKDLALQCIEVIRMLLEMKENTHKSNVRSHDSGTMIADQFTKAVTLELQSDGAQKCGMCHGELTTAVELHTHYHQKCIEEMATKHLDWESARRSARPKPSPVKRPNFSTSESSEDENSDSSSDDSENPPMDRNRARINRGVKTRGAEASHHHASGSPVPHHIENPDSKALGGKTAEGLNRDFGNFKKF